MIAMKKILLTLVFGLMCVAPQANAADAPPKEPTVEDRLADLEAYVNNAARQTNALSKIAGPGPGHNAWQMTSTALVLFMTLPGLALFYGGLVRKKNVLSVMAQCLGIAGLVTILWWICGYSLSFAGSGAFIGDLSMKIKNGMVTAEDVKVDGSAVQLALAGSASIPAREIDLKGTAALVTTSNPAATFELPFIVQGSWDDPIILPDPEALIRRSGAAAPLLNAVRNRGERDAARSVIERLTGAPPGTIPAAEQSIAPAGGQKLE